MPKNCRFSTNQKSKTLGICGFCGRFSVMAEGVGFEPTVPLTARSISSRVPSTGLSHPSFSLATTYESIKNPNLIFLRSFFYGQCVMSNIAIPTSSEKKASWTPTSVQFLYRHRNGGYYVRTYAGGKQKRPTLKTTLLSVAKNRMQEHIDASERLKSSGAAAQASGPLTFGEALAVYKERLASSADVRPNTKAFREAGIKLVLRSWTGIEATNVRKITSKLVDTWLRSFCASATPYVPNKAKTPARNSTGASATTIKCALDAIRHVLDVAFLRGRYFS